MLIQINWGQFHLLRYMYKVVLEVEPLLLFLDQIISYIRTGIKGLIQLMFWILVLWSMGRQALFLGYDLGFFVLASSGTMAGMLLVLDMLHIFWLFMFESCETFEFPLLACR